MTQLVPKIELYRWFRLLFLLGLLIACTRPTSAHSLGEGYVFIDVSNSSLSGWVEVTLTDLDAALSIDRNGDGKVSEDEALANLDRIRVYVFERVGIGSVDRAYTLKFTVEPSEFIR